MVSSSLPCNETGVGVPVSNPQRCADRGEFDKRDPEMKKKKKKIHSHEPSIITGVSGKESQAGSSAADLRAEGNNRSEMNTMGLLDIPELTRIDGVVKLGNIGDISTSWHGLELRVERRCSVALFRIEMGADTGACAYVHPGHHNAVVRHDLLGLSRGVARHGADQFHPSHPGQSMEKAKEAPRHWKSEPIGCHSLTMCRAFLGSRIVSVTRWSIGSVLRPRTRQTLASFRSALRRHDLNRFLAKARCCNLPLEMRATTRHVERFLGCSRLRCR